MTTTTSSSPLLILRDTYKRREKGEVIFELQIPQLSLDPGQFIAIVGTSGCGKSTLLDLLALVSRPTHCGQFTYFAPPTRQAIDLKQLWDDQNETGLATLRRSTLGYVLQTGGLLPFLTVWQNLQLPCKVNGYENDTQIRQFAQRFGVAEQLNKKPQHLSGGQRQRVAILRALSHRPQLILADEPTAAVDKERAQSIVRDFHTLAKEQGTTIVMVTHDHELVAPFAEVTYTFTVVKVSETLTQSTCQPVT